MQKIFLTVFLTFLPLLGQPRTGCPEIKMPHTAAHTAAALYEDLQLEGKLSEEALRLAVAGYEKITGRKRDVLTVIDFSKPSTEERLFVIDMRERQLLFSSVVAHGRNSGGVYATDFSNRDGSHQSSLGFYLTENTYQGKNGYSLVLEGLEKGVNDNARRRAIVVHGASYANPSVIRSGGRLGRSFGCPALPTRLNRPIIDAIKGGSVLYIYADDEKYLAQSPILNDNGSRPAEQKPDTQA